MKLIDKNYFLHKDFQATDSEAQQLIDDTVVKYSLNEEQERAFRIVANHAVQPSGEHLKMYLEGMAGTGKSQVIKALTYFFAERKESYRFMCLAPTGSAAALIGDSTITQCLDSDRKILQNLSHHFFKSDQDCRMWGTYLWMKLACLTVAACTTYVPKCVQL